MAKYNMDGISDAYFGSNKQYKDYTKYLNDQEEEKQAKQAAINENNKRMSTVSDSHYPNNEKNARMRDVSPAYNSGGSQYKKILGISDPAFTGGDQFAAYGECLKRIAEENKRTANDHSAVEANVRAKAADSSGNAVQGPAWLGYVSSMLPGITAMRGPNSYTDQGWVSGIMPSMGTTTPSYNRTAMAESSMAWQDKLKGIVPSLTYIDPLQKELTGFYIKQKPNMFNIINSEASLADQAVFRVEYGKIPGGGKAPHINVKAMPEDSGVVKWAAKSLDHEIIPEPVFNAVKDTGKIAKVAKMGGTALAVVGVAMDAYDIANAVSNDLHDEDERLGKKTASAVSGAALSWAGGAVGAKLGAMGGAALGTVLIPIPGLGTLVGGFIGGMVGGILGSMGGRYASDVVMDAIEWEE